MFLQGPGYKNRSPKEIITRKVHFDSVGYAYRSLSWLDVASRERNVCALQYAAHDARQAFEQLLFEELVLSVGTELDRKDYESCKGNSTKLHKIVRKLSPDYEKLSEFTQAIAATDPNAPPLMTWNHKELMKHWGKVSNYLHWAGEPAETIESAEWLDHGIATVSEAAEFIWDRKRAGYTGIMMPDEMQPEIRAAWERFRAGGIDIDAVKRLTNLALPTLTRRMREHP